LATDAISYGVRALAGVRRARSAYPNPRARIAFSSFTTATDNPGIRHVDEAAAAEALVASCRSRR
jgi:hypothetical protein